MKASSSWPRVSSTIRTNAFRPVANPCVFCQQHLINPRVTLSPSSTLQKPGATRLHELDHSKTGGPDSLSPWLQLQRRLRKARAEHQKLMADQNEQTLSEEQKAVRRRDRKAAKELRASEAARIRQEEIERTEWTDVQEQDVVSTGSAAEEQETARQEAAFRDLKEREGLDVELKESRTERRIRRKQEKADALLEWQASVDVALDKVAFPRPGTWDGLEMIGGEKEWDTGLTFNGYLHQTKLETKPEITAALYRAVVEILTAMSHEKNLQRLKNKAKPLAEIYHDVSKAKISFAAPQGSESSLHELQIEFPDQDVELRILQSLEHPAIETAETQDNMPVEVEGPLAALETKESLQEHIQAWGSDWYKISLENPTFKFPLIKRLTRLLGRPIPDSQIHSSNTVAQLLASIARPEPAKKLFQILTRSETSLVGVPNVTLKSRRQTPVDKETALGRWKVIRAELRRRGLPVLSGVTGWEMESVESMKLARKEAAAEM